MEQTKTKIFITYKDKHKIFKSDIITPIQTGRAIAKQEFSEMIGDDTSDNISASNPRYNELSAQYWVWKNQDKISNPDYIGFMHYRRHFIFDENSFNTTKLKRWLRGIPIFKVKTFDSKCVNNLSDENISKMIEQGYECYCMKEANINLYENNDLYMREHYLCYIAGAKRDIYNKFYNIVKAKYPQYINILDKFTYGHKMYCCNMFIMTKELFNRYNEFCFNILKELEQQVDYSYFNPVEMRFLGYIGEYVLSLFIMILESENRKIKYLDAIFIEDTDNSKFKFFSKLFSLKNRDGYKIITLFGVQIKLNNNNNQFKRQEQMLQKILTKVSELQEEIIMLKQNKNM